MSKSLTVAAVLGCTCLLLTGAGCDSRQKPTAHSTGSQSTTTMPADLILTQAPEGAVDVVAAKQSAQPGDLVVVRGKIGGRKDPFVEGRAIFQLVDASLPTCADNPGDGCPTPWDYCCEPKDQVAAKSTTVQVTGTDGKPLALNLNASGGFKPMATVIVRGKVAARPNESTMIVNADGIYVVKDKG